MLGSGSGRARGGRRRTLLGDALVDAIKEGERAAHLIRGATRVLHDFVVDVSLHLLQRPPPLAQRCRHALQDELVALIGVFRDPDVETAVRIRTTHLGRDLRWAVGPRQARAAGSEPLTRRTARPAATAPLSHACTQAALRGARIRCTAQARTLLGSLPRRWRA